MESFGTTFLRERKKRGLTQGDIASKLNVSPQAISKWESDISMPDVALLSSIADIFEISVDVLLGRKKEAVTKVVEQQKDINKMILKIEVNDEDSKVKVNLPIAIIKACLDSDQLPTIGGKDMLKNINFQEIFSLVEQGVVGKLVEIEEKDGSKVKIYVE